MSQWKCSLCTYLNHPALPTCEVCGHDRESPPRPSVDSDLEFAKRLQEQFDKESNPTIQTNDNRNRSIPKKQSNNARTSNSNSNTNSNSNSHSRVRSRSSISVSDPKPPNANSNPQNRNRKRKRSEMESNASDAMPSERHHNQCKIKEETCDYNRRDIVERIQYIRAGYETHSHHNEISTDVSPNTVATGNIGAVIGINNKYGYKQKHALTLKPKDTDFPYFIIDFNTTQVEITSYTIRHPIWHEWNHRTKQQEVRGRNNFMTAWVVEGRMQQSDNWTIIHRVNHANLNIEQRSSWTDVRFRIRVSDRSFDEYFTQIRFRMTALNSSRLNTMKLSRLRLYGNMRRKVYKLPRVDEYRTIDPFPAIGKNRCLGDIDQVFKILNDSESLQHLECKEYVEEVADLKVELKDYQKRGLQWLLHMENNGHNGIHGGLLCDEMGLGKTVQMIALMLVQKQRNQNASQSKDRSLIITPLSLIDQWISELDKIAGANTFKYINYYGNERKKLTRQDFDDCDIVFSTTATFGYSGGKPTTRYDDFLGTNWTQAFKQQIVFKLPDGFFTRIIVDESHEIKNTSSNRSTAICSFATRCHAKWCLSGTPIKNELPHDLAGMVRFVGIKHTDYCDALKLTTHEKAAQLSLPADMGDRRKENIWLDLNVAFCRDKIERFLSGIMLRRTKNQVLNRDFVEKEEIVMKYKLNAEEQVIYEKNLSEAALQYHQFKRGGSVLSQYLYLLRMLSKLRQICNHPSLVFNRASLFNANDQNDINLSNVMDVSSIDVLQRVEQMIIQRLNAMESVIDYECPVCYELSELKGVMLSNCGHLFCAECIDDLENKQCPLCREPFTPRNVLKITDILKSKELDSKHHDEYEAYKEEEGIHDHESKDNSDDTKNATKYKHYDEYLRKYGDASRSSSKVEALIERLKYIEQHHAGDKALLFSNFPSFFSVISRQLKRHNIGHLQFHGSMNRKQRKKILDEFKTSAECKVLIISAKCASVGLNLMCANHVIFIEPRYNPGLDNQAIGRCWRIGQTKKVYVTRVIMEETVEETILRLQQSKEENEEAGLVNLKQKSKLSEQDFDIIFKYAQGNYE